MIVLYSNQNNATVPDTEISPTLPASMGLGGGYVPMIVVSDDEQHLDNEDSGSQ